MSIVGSITWRTSTFTSNGQSCVEVALTDTVTAVRDTKHRGGGHLTLPAARGAAFFAAVKSGRFRT